MIYREKIKDKKMKKQLILALAGLLLATALTSCSGGDSPAVTTTSAVGGETVTSATDAETLGVPERADYGGAAFNILSAGNVAYADFTAEEDSSTSLDSAQYRRRELVEQNYNVQITETVEKAYSSGGGPGYKRLSTDANAGDCNFDLALVAGYDVTVLAYSDYLYDLASIPGIDLSKSWWDQRANESLAVRGVMFFTTGELTVSDNNVAFVVLFNKDMHKAYDLDDPYQLVYDGDWTLDTFGALCKTVTEDLDQNGEMNASDRFGLLVWDDSVVGIVNAAGQRCCTVNDDGKIELTLYNETTVAALDKYFSIIYDTQYALTYQREKVDPLEMWQADKGLFWMTTMDRIPQLRNMESDFGILPYPKLNTAQKDYYTTVAPYNSQFICVPLIQSDVERTGVITEALAYYGKQIVTPAYYDINLVGQSTRDEESSDMLEIIFDNLVFDLGYYYQVGPYNKQLIRMVQQRDSNFTSMYDSYKNSAEKLLTVINTYYGKAVAGWLE